MIAVCPDKKNSSDDNCVRSIKFYIENYNIADTPLITECQLDSGSPISFIKNSLINKKIILDPVNEQYYGLNESPVEVYGKTKCYVLKKSKKIYFDLFVVADSSMGHDVVVGRNFLNACGLHFNADVLDLISVKETCSTYVAKRTILK